MPNASNTSEIETRRIFEQMCSAALDEDDELLRLYESAKSSGLDYAVAATQSTAFKDDGGLPYTEVAQNLTLMLGGVLVVRVASSDILLM